MLKLYIAGPFLAAALFAVACSSKNDTASPSNVATNAATRVAIATSAVATSAAATAAASATAALTAVPTAAATATSTAASATPAVTPSRSATPATTATPTVAGGSASPAPVAPSEATATEEIKQFEFLPNKQQVKVGTKVTWTNTDAIIHSVTSGVSPAPNGIFDSDFFDQGQNYTFTFSKPGQYTYFCKRHPFMQGEIDVIP